MGGRGRGTKNTLRSPFLPQSFLKTPKCFRTPALQVEVLHRKYSKTGLISGLFLPARSANTGGACGFRANVSGGAETRDLAVFPLSALSVLCFCECYIRTTHRIHAGSRPRV